MLCNSSHRFHNESRFQQLTISNATPVQSHPDKNNTTNNQLVSMSKQNQHPTPILLSYCPISHHTTLPILLRLLRFLLSPFSPPFSRRFLRDCLILSRRRRSSSSLSIHRPISSILFDIAISSIKFSIFF